MGNRAKFEADVRARLEKSLAQEGFIVDEFTSAITPPQSLTEMIDAKKNKGNSGNNGGGVDVVAQIEKLAKLKEAGIISEEEFSAKKAALLDKI